MDDAHIVDWVDCENKIGNVDLGVSLFKINFVYEELSETAATSVI
jgi:hypothetical protein